MNNTQQQNRPLHFIGIVMALFLVGFIILVLIKGAALLTPIVMAIVLWYLIVSLANFLQRIKFGRKSRKIPDWLALVAAIGLILLGCWIVILIISQNVTQLSQELPVYQEKIQTLVDQLMANYNLPEDETIQNLTSIDFTGFLKNIVSAMSSLVSLGGTVIIYVIFLLFEYRTFDKKIDKLFPDKEKSGRIKKTFNKINQDTQKYIFVQTMISFATGILAYFILLSFGVKFAAFWGLLTFILNFIPFIGSILATIFPVIFALVDLESGSLVVVIFLLLFTVQFVLGNIVSPKMMGKTLNLSPLVILLSLSLWGSTWGIVGAFLSVPIMVILNIVLAQFQATRFLAVLLSQEGSISEDVVQE